MKTAPAALASRVVCDGAIARESFIGRMKGRMAPPPTEHDRIH